MAPFLRIPSAKGEHRSGQSHREDELKPRKKQSCQTAVTESVLPQRVTTAQRSKHYSLDDRRSLCRVKGRKFQQYDWKGYTVEWVAWVYHAPPFY